VGGRERSPRVHRPKDDRTGFEVEICGRYEAVAAADNEFLLLPGSLLTSLPKSHSGCLLSTRSPRGTKKEALPSGGLPDFN
jgi:hypothetical protein